MNESTIKAIQGIIGVTQDGIWGPKSQAALDAIIHPPVITGVSGLTVQLRNEYNSLFDTCETRAAHEGEVANFIKVLLFGKPEYETVEALTQVPWYVIGLIHGMECSFSFKQHLHNGDPLTRRTVNVPAGRPPSSVGDPPFSWSVSAVDALQYDHFTNWRDWSVAGICYKLEGYNGWGYRKHRINSPYLWSYSNQYSRGKYVADGQWDSDAVSKQVGAITALKQMVVDHQVEVK